MPPVSVHAIPLTNPLQNPDAHAQVYALLPALIGASAEALSKRYPSLDKQVAYRLTELVTAWGLQVPWMVLSHEEGHAGACRRLGWEPTVRIRGWMAGETSYTFPPTGEAPSLEKRQRVTAGGVTQEQWNAVRIFERWAQSEGVSHEEALGFLLAKTNLLMYALVSIKDAEAIPHNDLSNYIRRAETLGAKLSYDSVAAYALAADLLSASVWSALASQVDFLVTGDRVAKAPSVSIAGTQVTLPSFNILLDAQGPILGAQAFVSARDRALGLGIHFRPIEPAAAATLDLPRIALGAMSLSTRVGVSWDETLGVGSIIGGTLSAGRGGTSLSVSLDKPTNFLLSEPLGFDPNLLRLGAQIEFRL